MIQVLGENWTVKLIIVDEQSLNSSWLFKYIKHPNYFLNIIPELIGLTMFFHSWITIMFFSCLMEYVYICE
ncbi:isoprenylcysteine carboxylmethyltransferase family protein [Enterococcus faecalis]